MTERPFLVGLTGSIGMGKTEVGNMFAALGIPVFDSDAAVHSLYMPCGEAVELVGKVFPDAVIDGAVDRKILTEVLARDPYGFAKLEKIVHPLVVQKQREFIAAHLDAALIVFDIPLLFESGADGRMDAVVVVSAAEEIQRERVLARPGMTAAKFDRILKRQMPDLEKCTLADYVVDTGASLEHTREQVLKIVEDLNVRRQTV